MSERIRLINDYENGDFGISELAQQYQVSRKTVYKWIERFERQSWEGLQDQSRAPEHHPNAIPEQLERAVLELKCG